MIYPIPPVHSLKELIAYCTQCEEHDGILFEFLTSQIEGRRLWTLWKASLDGQEHFAFIQLFKLYQKEDGWCYEQFMFEIEFGDHLKCPISFLHRAIKSPYVYQEWRDAVVTLDDVFIPEDWEQCKKLFGKLSARNTGEVLRVHFKGLQTRFTGVGIPYADVVSTSPFRGRYNGKLFSLKRSAISGYEIIQKPRHPRGHLD